MEGLRDKCNKFKKQKLSCGFSLSTILWGMEIVGSISAASARDTERTDDHREGRGWKRNP